MAIIGVLVGHFVENQQLNLGRFGVELFFVLSGRLMAEILFEKKVPLRYFFPRRFARIYPALIAFCTASFLVAYLLKLQAPSLLQYLSAITLTMNYAYHWAGRASVLDHIWSLCIEEHMYIFLGALAFVARRRAVPVAAICLCVAAIGMTGGLLLTLRHHDYANTYWRTDVRGASIAVSAGIYLLLSQRLSTALTPPLMPVLLAAISLALNFAVVPDPIKYSLGTTCLALSLCLMHRAPAIVLKCVSACKSDPHLGDIGVQK